MDCRITLLKFKIFNYIKIKIENVSSLNQTHFSTPVRNLVSKEKKDVRVLRTMRKNIDYTNAAKNVTKFVKTV